MLNVTRVDTQTCLTTFDEKNGRINHATNQDCEEICDDVAHEEMIEYRDDSSKIAEISNCWKHGLSSEFHLNIPSQLITLVQALMTPKIKIFSREKEDLDASISLESMEDTHGVSIFLKESVRGHAIVALGKLCLGNRDLAKQCIVAFVKELGTCDSPVVRNNILVMLADLCC